MSSFQNPSRESIKELLQQSKRIAVVGLSDQPQRTSYSVSQAMQEAGYNIYPVNPHIKQSLGVPSVSRLSELKEPVDIVNVFRKSSAVRSVVEEAITIKPRAIWMQFGVIDEEAARLATEAGIMVIMDRCIKVEHALLIPFDHTN